MIIMYNDMLTLNDDKNKIQINFQDKYKFTSKEFMARIATVNLNRSDLDGELRLDEYFERIDPEPPDQPSNETLRPSFDNGVNFRADITTVSSHSHDLFHLVSCNKRCPNISKISDRVSY